MTTKKEMTLLEKVWASIKGGEAAEKAKLVKFYGKLRKVEDTEIKKLEANKKGAELQFEIDKASLKDQIEDATEKVEEAFENVTADNIKTNASMEDYGVTYWAGVKRAESNLTSLEDKLEGLVEGYEDNIKALDEQIAKRESRIAKIS